MLTRTAIYEGKPKNGREAEFFKRVANELQPLWKRFPGYIALRVQITESSEQDAPDIAMVVEMDFLDQAAMDAGNDSDVRSHLQATTTEVMRLFDGCFYHVISNRSEEL